jgi:hypothetical protein
MYDNLNFKIRGDVGVDYLSETPNYFHATGEHLFDNNMVITGDLNGFKVAVNERGVNVTDGSLCKWFLGDNFQTLGRGDTQRAIEKLSDTLHLPFDKAKITRIDAAQNIIVKYPIPVYLNHLGELQYYTREPMIKDGSLYYESKGKRIIFYDKVREQKRKGHLIPEMYAGQNVLRFETRYLQRLPSIFKVEKVTGELLYDEAFYIDIFHRWLSTYKSIKKINDINLNFGIMKTKQELYKMGLVSLIEQRGGQPIVLEQINEAQKRGELTRKQAYDLRQAVNDVCSLGNNLTVENDAIKELDKKVKIAARFCR